MAEDKSKKTTKIKKKKWIQVLAPTLFKNEVLGEIPVTEPKLLIGRSISVSLMALTRDMKKQNIIMRFSIDSVKESTANTNFYGYYLNQASIRRLVRRGKEKIGLIVVCKTSDNKKVRMMVLIIPYSKITGSVATAYRNQATKDLIDYIGKSTFENILKDMITNKLQRDIKGALKKIYPARIIEIAKLHIEKEKKPGAEVKIEEPVEEVKEEPVKEVKEEAPKEETKEVKVKEEAKSE